MKRFKTLVFPGLILCFLLVLGGYFLGRQSRSGVVLTTQKVPPAPSETLWVRAPDPGETTLAGTSAPAPEGLLDLNTATLEELATLPGIGPVRAQRILDYRAQHGPFQHTTDLINVNGIGEGIFAGLKDLIYVEAYHEDSDH